MRLEQLGRDGLLGDHALDDAAAVAKDGEQQLAAGAQVVEPAADGDGLAFVLADFANRADDGGFGFRSGQGIHGSESVCPLERKKAMEAGGDWGLGIGQWGLAISGKYRTAAC